MTGRRRITAILAIALGAFGSYTKADEPHQYMVIKEDGTQYFTDDFEVLQNTYGPNDIVYSGKEVNGLDRVWIVLQMHGFKGDDSNWTYDGKNNILRVMRSQEEVNAVKERYKGNPRVVWRTALPWHVDEIERHFPDADIILVMPTEEDMEILRPKRNVILIQP